MNDTYEIIDSVELLVANEDIKEKPLENHEFVLIDVGHYLVNSYYREEVSNIPESIEQNKFDPMVVAVVLQEMKNGEVKCRDHPSLYGLSVEHNDYTKSSIEYSDYMHINDAVIDPEDNNILISSRNSNTILKLDRNTEEIIWSLVGKDDEFGLTEEQKFKHHHLMPLSDGSQSKLSESS